MVIHTLLQRLFVNRVTEDKAGRAKKLVSKALGIHKK